MIEILWGNQTKFNKQTQKLQEMTQKEQKAKTLLSKEKELHQAAIKSLEASRKEKQQQQQQQKVQVQQPAAAQQLKQKQQQIKTAPSKTSYQTGCSYRHDHS